METSHNGSYTGLIGAVLRARSRTGCANLAIAVRGERAAVVLRVPIADERGCPTTFSHYVTGFCSPTFISLAEESADALTTASLRAHVQVALSIARTPQRHTALVDLLRSLPVQEALAW